MLRSGLEDPQDVVVLDYPVPVIFQSAWISLLGHADLLGLLAGEARACHESLVPRGPSSS